MTTPSFTGAEIGNQEAPSGESASDGVGVQMHSGEFIFSAGAGGAKGVGMPFGMSLVYRSHASYDGAVGKNWFWLGSLGLTDSGTTVRLHFVRHTEMSFTWDSGTSSWDHDDSGWLGTLEETSPDSGDFTYTLPSGLEFLFTAGKIDTITDRFGNTIDATHNGSGELTSVSDTRGVSHTIAYYNTGRVKTITYADGRVWKFIYNEQAQLTRIEGPATTSFPNGIIKEFRYINGSPNGALNNNMTVCPRRPRQPLAPQRVRHERPREHPEGRTIG